MSLRIEPPEKKKRGKKTKNSSPPPLPPSSSPSFSLLPDEITVNYLARISRSYYPRLSIVSKSFQSLTSSTELYAARSQLGSTEQCLYVCIRAHSYQFPQWYRLWINPNRDLPDDMIKQKSKKKKKTIGQLLVPIASSDFPSLGSAVAVGSDIYVIGGPILKPVVRSDIEVIGGLKKTPSSAVRILDCRSHSWRDGPSMHVSRKNAASCAQNGKIYVMGGCKEDESWAEVFDTKTQTWERLSDPGNEIRKCYINIITEMEGKIYFGNSNIIYAYDTKQCEWESCENKSATYERLQLRLSWAYHYELDCSWYDIEDGCWKNVKGLESLVERYQSKCYHPTKVVSCGGKYFVVWEGYMKVKRTYRNSKKIWCTEIVVEKRDGGEVWGTVKWVDIVLTVPPSCGLYHCLAVTV